MGEKPSYGGRGRAHRAQAADAEAIAALNDRFRAPLASYFLKRVDQAEDVDDLVQEVFLRLATRADLADVKQMDGYLFATAANVLRDRFRRQAVLKPEFHDEYVDDAHSRDSFSPERVLLGKDELRLVIAAIEELPKRTRRIFLMRRYEGLRLKEIAAKERMSESGVRKQLIKAKVHIAKRMGREEER